MVAEPAPLPGDDGARLDEDENVPPAGPAPGQPRPQQPIGDLGARSRRASLVDGELVAQREDLELEGGPRSEDDLDAEIELKFKRGYPRDNIIFEDSTQAVLIQNREEVMRCAVDDVAALEKLLNLFFGFERTEVAKFRKACQPAPRS